MKAAPSLVAQSLSSLAQSSGLHHVQPVGHTDALQQFLTFVIAPVTVGIHIHMPLVSGLCDQRTAQQASH